MEKEKGTTYQEGITDDPSRIASPAPNIRSLRQVEDTAKAVIADAGNAAEVHVRRVDRPRFAPKGHLDVEIGIAR